jgi:hypothetical protein
MEDKRIKARIGHMYPISKPKERKEVKIFGSASETEDKEQEQGGSG